MPLDDLQRSHLRSLDRDISRRLIAKYARGADEHGGYIWDQDPLTLVNNAIDESVDQLVYLLTLRDQLIDAQTKAEAAQAKTPDTKPE